MRGQVYESFLSIAGIEGGPAPAPSAPSGSFPTPTPHPQASIGRDSLSVDSGIPQSGLLESSEYEAPPVPRRLLLMTSKSPVSWQQESLP